MMNREASARSVGRVVLAREGEEAVMSDYWLIPIAAASAAFVVIWEWIEERYGDNDEREG